MKLLEKLNLLEEVNQLKGKNIPFYQDTFLRDPLVSTIRQNLATSDYESDLDNDSDEEIDATPVVNDDIFKFSTSRSYEPTSQFSNTVNKETYTSSGISKTSQLLKNYDPHQIKFEEKESFFPNSYKFNSNQQFKSNAFSSINSKQSYDVNCQPVSLNFDTRIEMTDQSSSQRNIEDSLNNRLTEVNHEDKAVKTLELENEAQKISNNNEICESSKNYSNNFLNKDLLQNTPNIESTYKSVSVSENLQENEPNLPTMLPHKMSSSEEASVIYEVNRIETIFSKEGQENQNEKSSEVGQVDLEPAHISEENTSCGKTISQLTEISDVKNHPSDSTVGMNLIREMSENINLDARHKNEEPVSILEEFNGTETPKNVHLQSIECTTRDEITNLYVHTETENFPNEQGVNIHNHKPSSTGEVINSIESPTTVEEIIDLAEDSAPVDIAIDLESLPDTNSFRSTKTSVSESISNGLLTIEILDDDNDDGADYTFINHREKGQPSFDLNNTPINLLQSNEIKLEENEENHSPNFSIAKSGRNDQNFVNSNKDSRNSDSTGINKLKNNSTNGSVKELEIIISDSEDEMLEVPEQDGDDIPTETFKTTEVTECLNITDEELVTDTSPSVPEEHTVIQSQNLEVHLKLVDEVSVADASESVELYVSSEPQVAENATEAIVTLVDGNDKHSDGIDVEELNDSNASESLQTADLVNEEVNASQVLAIVEAETENNYCSEVISTTEEPEVEKSSSSVENIRSHDKEQLRKEIYTTEIVSTLYEPKTLAIIATETIEEHKEKLYENHTDNDEIQTITSLEQLQDTVDEVLTTETAANYHIALPTTTDFPCEEAKTEFHSKDQCKEDESLCTALIETPDESNLAKQNEQLEVVGETSTTFCKTASKQQNDHLTTVEETPIEMLSEPQNDHAATVDIIEKPTEQQNDRLATVDEIYGTPIETTDEQQNDDVSTADASEKPTEATTEQQNDCLATVDEIYETSIGTTNEQQNDFAVTIETPGKLTESIMKEQYDCLTTVDEIYGASIETTNEQQNDHVFTVDTSDKPIEATTEQQNDYLATVDEIKETPIETTNEQQNDHVSSVATSEKSTVDETFKASVEMTSEEHGHVAIVETLEKPTEPTNEQRHNRLATVDETFEAPIEMVNEQQNDHAANVETPKKPTEATTEQNYRLGTVEETSEAPIEMVNEQQNDHAATVETLKKPTEATTEQKYCLGTVDETFEASFEMTSEQHGHVAIVETLEKPTEPSNYQRDNRLATVDETSETPIEMVNEQQNDHGATVETLEKPTKLTCEQENDPVATVDETTETHVTTFSEQQNYQLTTVNDTFKTLTQTVTEQDYLSVNETSELSTEQQNVQLLTVEETFEIPIKSSSEVCEILRTDCVTDPLNDQTSITDTTKFVNEEEHSELLNTKITAESQSEDQCISEVPESDNETMDEHQNTVMVITEVPEITNDLVKEHSISPRNKNELITYEAVNNQYEEENVPFEATTESTPSQAFSRECENHIAVSDAPTNENEKQIATLNSESEITEVPVEVDHASVVQVPNILSEQQNTTGQCLKPTFDNLETFEKSEGTLEVIDYSTTAQYTTETSGVETYDNTYRVPEGVPEIYGNTTIYHVEQPAHQEASMNLSVHNETQSLKEDAVKVLQDTITSEVLKDNVSREVEKASIKPFYYKSNISSTLSEVEYVEYSSVKKVNGDLELLANIAADQETLAVKTDSEKEVVDTASEADNDTKILDISHSTPKRRKSKVRLDYRKKILSRETLPRAVKQFQRKYPLKQKPDNEETDNKRITRNRASAKPKIELLIPKEPPKQLRTSRSFDVKYKPHDFISMENPTLPPPTNNVYAQKRLMEANTTSEDSNDSCESTLFIDLSDSGKSAEKTIKSVYEEETIIDMLEFVNTEEKIAVCISIPENEGNCISESFHILKQMEDFVDGSNDKQAVQGNVPEIEQNIEGEKYANDVTNTEPMIENAQPLTIDTTSESSENTPENLTVENSMLHPSNEDKLEAKIVKTTDHSIENILNKTPPIADLKLTTLNGVNEIISNENESNQIVSNESENLLALQNQRLEKEVIKLDLVLLKAPEEILGSTKSQSIDQVHDVTLEKQSLLTSNVVSSNTSVTAVIKESSEPSHQSQPENLTVSKAYVPRVKCEDNCEKTFKTKAAMKAYEDKIQPNPYVLLQNCVKSKVFNNKTVMRTRLRSKSSEQPHYDIYNRNRSSSVDSHSIGLKDKSERFVDLNKSRTSNVDENINNLSTSPVVTNIDEKKTEITDSNINTENLQKSTELNQILLPPEIAVPVVTISSECVTEIFPLINKEVELIDSIQNTSTSSDTIHDEQIPSDMSVSIQSDKFTVTKSLVFEETKIVSNDIEVTTFPEVSTSHKVITPSQVLISTEVPTSPIVLTSPNVPTSTTGPTSPTVSASSSVSTSHELTTISEVSVIAVKNDDGKEFIDNQDNEKKLKEEKASTKESESVIASPPKTPKLLEKNNTDKTTTKSGQEKGRSLEITIKNLKEKIVEFEKAKKEQVSSKSSTEKGALKRTDDTQTNKEKNDDEKKHEKVPSKSAHSGDVKEKSHEVSKKDAHHKKRRSRSSSKSRTSDKKVDQVIEKDTSSKENSSRSSSKSRSVDKYSRHHSDGEGDRKRRSNSRSVDEKDKKNRLSDQEDANGHKRRSRSSSKSKSLERKLKQDSSSSKHKTDLKDKQTVTDNGKDHKKISNKSPSGSKSNEAKGKLVQSDKKSDTDKEKAKDKVEEPKETKNKSNNNSSKVESKNKIRADEKPLQHDKDKGLNENPEKSTKDNDGKPSKSSKSHKTKSKSRENSSTKLAEQKEKNDEKENDKGKPRDTHKPKPKDPSKHQESKSEHEVKSVEVVKNDKSRRSHSKEKIKTESVPRSDKREKTSSKFKESDKKSNHRNEERKESGVASSKDKQKETKKVSDHIKEHKENVNNNNKPSEGKVNDHSEERKENSSSTGNILVSQEVNAQLKNHDVVKHNGEEHSLVNKDKPKVDIPKKRKYEFVEENYTNSSKIEQVNIPEPKIPKVQLEIPVETADLSKESNLSQKLKVPKLHLEIAVDTADLPKESKQPQLVVKEDELSQKPKTPKLNLEIHVETADIPNDPKQPQLVEKEDELPQKPRTSKRPQPVVKENELPQKPKTPKLHLEIPVEIANTPKESKHPQPQKPLELKKIDVLAKDNLQNGAKELATPEINEYSVVPLIPSKETTSTAIDLSYESFARGVPASVVSKKIQEDDDKMDVLVPTALPVPTVIAEEKNVGDAEIQPPTPLISIDNNKEAVVCYDASTNQQLQSSEVCNLNSQDEAKKDMEIIAPPTILLDTNVPITLSESVYVSTAFSTAAATLGMQVLPNTIDSTVKQFTVQTTDLPLIPSVLPTSTIAGGIVTTCDLTRPITVQSTPSCSTTTIQDKSCLFTFNDGETDNRENINTTDLFDASLGLEDISPTKLPIGSNPSLDLISPSTSIAEISNSMNLVQTLGTSTINFINDVPDNSEIDIQQPNKQSSFSSNFARGTRVTEIRCFVEKESTADHNYTLGDPLLGGNNEDKNILTTGLSLSNSPEEFQLNESHLDELAFNENNFIEENGTLEDLGLLLPCKKEKPDFDNIIDDAIPKPEDIQNSIKRLNMLVDISQSGQQKTISVDNTIDHTSNTDCSVSLGIDYAVNKLLFLGGGEVTSQNTTFSTIPDIENMNIMESSVPPPMLHPNNKEHLEEPIAKSQDESSSIAAICTSYANFMPTDSNQKVVVEPVEQCPITSLDQLKKDYINDTTSEIMEKSKPMNKSNRVTKSSSGHKSKNFATFLQSVKRDTSKNDSMKVKDEIENYTVRRHNRTPVFPPKKKTATQQHHTKSPPQIKKTEILSFENNVPESKSQAKQSSETANECRIRVKTDLIKPTESKSLVNDLSQLDYINENDQNIASEIVLPFSKPSPSEKVNLVDVPPKKTAEINPKIDIVASKSTKHARFDKSGNDYIMENIINAHSDLKNRKSQVSEVKTTEKKTESALDNSSKRKSTLNDNSDTSDNEKCVKRGDKRQKKSDDESDKNRIPVEHTKSHSRKSHDGSVNNKAKSLSTDDIFDQLYREGSTNKLFTQRMNEQSTQGESNQTNVSPEVTKNRGYSTVPENYRKDRVSLSQPVAGQHYESARHRNSARHPYSEADKRRDQRKPGYYSSNYIAPDRRYADKRPNTVAVPDTSPKRFIRNSSHPYSSKSDPCTSRDHHYKSRDRRSSTEQLNNPLPNRSEGGNVQEDDKFSWIDKFSGSGLFDTPSDLFMPPGTKREDTSARK